MERSGVLKAIPTVCPLLCLACCSPGEPQWRQARPHGARSRIHLSIHKEVSECSRRSAAFRFRTHQEPRSRYLGSSDIPRCVGAHPSCLRLDVCVCAFLPDGHASKQQARSNSELSSCTCLYNTKLQFQKE